VEVLSHHENDDNDGDNDDDDEPHEESWNHMHDAESKLPNYEDLLNQRDAVSEASIKEDDF
jgi:hypothetical protein